MNTGITIEQLIATVARIEASMEKRQRDCEELLHFPAVPFREDFQSLARPGVA
jgi:hypothetical protein